MSDVERRPSRPLYAVFHDADPNLSQSGSGWVINDPKDRDYGGLLCDGIPLPYMYRGRRGSPDPRTDVKEAGRLCDWAARVIVEATDDKYRAGTFTQCEDPHQPEYPMWVPQLTRQSWWVRITLMDGRSRERGPLSRTEARHYGAQYDNGEVLVFSDSPERTSRYNSRYISEMVTTIVTEPVR